MGKRNKDIPFWAKLGHGKPVSRRDFLSTGIIPFAAYAVGPSISSLLIPERAFGADAGSCSSGTSGPQMIPFITLNLSGGPSLASQLAVKDLNGNNLKSYTKIGLGAGPGVSFNVDKEFGNVEFAGTAIGGTTTGLVSKFLTGMRDPLAANGPKNPALAKTAFVSAAVALNDDTGGNQLDVSGLVIKMGLSGSKLPNLGRLDTSTGIGQQPTVTPPPAPFVVGSVTDLTNALGYAGSLAALSIKQKTSLAKVIGNLSSSQIQRISQTNGASVTAQLAECAGLRNIDLVSSGGGDVNPYVVPGTGASLAGIWGVAVNNLNNQDAVFGAMVYNGIVGNASTINLNLGGYDYHDSTRTTGNARDLAAGQVVGKILQTAALLGKPVFIYVCADGATVSGELVTADSVWVSDRGIAGMQYMLAYDPKGRPDTSGSQIGGFNAGQAADGSFPTGADGGLSAQAVFSNYAALNGQTAFLQANRIASDDGLRAKVIKFHKG
jgi:hypothetical protein